MYAFICQKQKEQANELFLSLSLYMRLFFFLSLLIWQPTVTILK